MKTKTIVCFLLTVLSILSACDSKKEKERIFDPKYKVLLKDVRREYFFYLTRNFMPGSSVAVSVKGKTVWSEGFGLASTDLEVKANRFTKYRIGEVTQILTAIAYWRMVEMGKINPKATVQQYFPAFSEKSTHCLFIHWLPKLRE